MEMLNEVVEDEEQNRLADNIIGLNVHHWSLTVLEFGFGEGMPYQIEQSHANFPELNLNFFLA